LGALAKQHALCLADCHELERAGLVSPGACTPPILSNPNAPTRTKTCVLRWRIKALSLIQARCAVAEGGQRPACHQGDEGIGWVTMVEELRRGPGSDLLLWLPEPGLSRRVAAVPS
jgi:hypothetical protein